MNQALAFMPKINLDVIVSPSFVSVVYRPKNRQKIADYLHELLPAAHLVNPAIPDCGSPFIEDAVRDSHRSLNFISPVRQLHQY